MSNDSQWTWDNVPGGTDNPYADGQWYGAQPTQENAVNPDGTLASPSGSTAYMPPSASSVSDAPPAADDNAASAAAWPAGAPSSATQWPDVGSTPPWAAADEASQVPSGAPSWASSQSGWQQATDDEAGQSYAQYDSGRNPYSGSFDYRPGIIPLRPLAFGEFFDGGFKAIQHNPRVMFGLSLIVGVITSVFQLGLLWFVGRPLFERAVRSVDEFNAAIPGTLWTLLVGILFSAIASIILNGLLITSVQQSIIGRKVTIGQVWSESKSQILRLFGLTFTLAGIAAAAGLISILLIGILIVPFADTSSGSSEVFLGSLTLIFMLVLMVPGVYLATRLALSSSALMIEKCGVFAALGRSWQLSRGFVGRNFGVLLLAGIVAGFLSSVVNIPAALFGSAVTSLPPELLPLAAALPSVLVTLIMALVTPFLAAITALLYVDLRMRKEGLDVQLIRAAGTTF